MQAEDWKKNLDLTSFWWTRGTSLQVHSACISLLLEVQEAANVNGCLSHKFPNFLKIWIPQLLHHIKLWSSGYDAILP
jgi:hypothetical protein